MKMNIVLTGMMGSGKTMIAKALAKKLRVPLLSTDGLVEKKARRKIKDMVAQKGWEYFRALEHGIIAQVSKKKGVIIDCGGGVVLDPKNMALLKKNGIIFYLEAPPEVLHERLKNDPHRPLLQVADPLAELSRIYTERLPLYSQADYIINASDASIAGPVEQILAKVKS